MPAAVNTLNADVPVLAGYLSPHPTPLDDLARDPGWPATKVRAVAKLLRVAGVTTVVNEATIRIIDRACIERCDRIASLAID